MPEFPPPMTPAVAIRLCRERITELHKELYLKDSVPEEILFHCLQWAGIANLIEKQTYKLNKQATLLKTTKKEKG